jgi:cell division topological specificity factor
VGIFSFFRTSPPQRTAEVAKERLQMLLAIERKSGASLDFLPQLQDDLIEVIKKYVQVDNDKVAIEIERGPDFSMLEINIELPTQTETRTLRQTIAARVAAAT